jgi:DNA-binding NtrC family response regulator
VFGSIYVEFHLAGEPLTLEVTNYIDTVATLVGMAAANGLRCTSEFVNGSPDVTDRQEADRLGNLVGGSAAMQEVYSLIQESANTDLPILIRGETGTGKELAARAIHDSGNRAKMPFVTQNCAAISPSLLESELFGHAKGAFTGADSDRRGLFEAADGGTVLLDEIGDASARVQASLLRVLQTGEVRRIGETATRAVNVRVMAATNQDLESLVEDGRFRRDLYYRLRVIEINMPALRDRTEDIPLLARHLAAKAAEAEGKSVPGIDHGAVGWLTSRIWNGNVRELENEVRRAVALVGDGGVLTEQVFNGGGRAVQVAPGRNGVHRDLRSILGAVEKSIIETSLDSMGGNVSETARRLGLTRPGLYKKLKRHGLKQ